MDQIEKVGRAWASFSSMTPRKGVSDPKCPLGTVLWRLHGSFARRWDQGSGAAARGRQPAVQAAWTWPGCPRRRSVPTSAVLASGRETASPTGVPYGPGGRSAGLGREEGPHCASLSRISKIPLKTKCDFYSLQHTFRNKWDWCPCHLIGTIVPSYRDRNPALPHPARYAHALAFRSGLYFTKIRDMTTIMINASLRTKFSQINWWRIRFALRAKSSTCALSLSLASHPRFSTLSCIVLYTRRQYSIHAFQQEQLPHPPRFAF